MLVVLKSDISDPACRHLSLASCHESFSLEKVYRNVLSSRMWECSSFSVKLPTKIIKYDISVFTSFQTNKKLELSEFDKYM